MSKAALIYLTRAISFDWARDGIRANCVSPGPIATQYNIDRLANDRAMWDKLERGTTIGRLGVPHEVAEAVCFLATCETDFIQGARSCRRRRLDQPLTLGDVSRSPTVRVHGPSADIARRGGNACYEP